MKFNEWLTQNDQNLTDGFKNNDSELEVSQDDALITNQLEQWVTKLNGLLHNVEESKREKLLEKVVRDIARL